MQHGGCEVRQMNPKLGQRGVTINGLISVIGQGPESYCSIRNYHSFLRVTSTDEEKRPMKDTMMRIQIIHPKHIALHAGQRGGASSAEVGALSPMFKNQIQNSNQNQNYLNEKAVSTKGNLTINFKHGKPVILAESIYCRANYKHHMHIRIYVLLLRTRNKILSIDGNLY